MDLFCIFDWNWKIFVIKFPIRWRIWGNKLMSIPSDDPIQLSLSIHNCNKYDWIGGDNIYECEQRKLFYFLYLVFPILAVIIKTVILFMT